MSADSRLREGRLSAERLQTLGCVKADTCSDNSGSVMSARFGLILGLFGGRVGRFKLVKFVWLNKFYHNWPDYGTQIQAE